MKRDRSRSASPQAVAKVRRQLLVGWAFAAFWLLFVGGFDVYIAWTAGRQVHAAKNWQQSTATIVSSEIVTSPKRKGKTSHRPTVNYEYVIDGQRYTGSTIEAFGVQSTGRAYAQGISGAYQKGATVPVFVDPNDPKQSALRVGLQPATARMVLLSLPFNAVLLGLIPFLIRARGYAADPMRAWLVVDEPDRAVVRVLLWAPWTLGCLAMGVSSAVGIFVTLVPHKGEPPTEHVLWAIGGSVFVGLVLYAWRRAQIGSGRFDLEFDRLLGRVSLPKTKQSFENASMRFEQLEVEVAPDPDRQINHAPSWRLHLRQSGTQAGYTVYWLERPTAKLLGRWIAGECGVRLKTVQPSAAPE